MEPSERHLKINTMKLNYYLTSHTKVNLNGLKAEM